MKDRIHLQILRSGLEIISSLLQRKYSSLIDFVFFSGGTSLMFKYPDFPRFSKDLDFAVSREAKNFDKLFYHLFADFKLKLEKFCEEKEIPIYSSFGDWREFVFQGEIGTTSIKIDFMYDYVLEFEQCCNLKKVSDLDIFVNKLQRLSKTDLVDLKFLQKKNRFSVREIVDALRLKSKNLHGNKYYLDTIVLQKLSNSTSFNFLNQIKYELGKV